MVLMMDLLFVNTCLASRLLSSSWLTTVCFSHFPSLTSCFVLPEEDKTRVKTGICLFVCLISFLDSVEKGSKQTKGQDRKRKNLRGQPVLILKERGMRGPSDLIYHLFQSVSLYSSSLLIVSFSFKLGILFMPFMSPNVWWDQDADWAGEVKKQYDKHP